MSDILPAITLYQPWATWIMRGWKTIETRTHDRLASLNNRIILIHAGLKTDEKAANNPYLSKEQILHDPGEVVNGYLLGTATVCQVGWLGPEHSEYALIECLDINRQRRYGLWLINAIKFETPIPCKGEMGIWYYDMDARQKVKKNQINQLKLL